MKFGHQLVGTRKKFLVGQMQPQELVEVWTQATTRIVKYGFAIEYRDLEPPRTGIFDGRRLVIDPDVGFEMQCFVLLHLFGHSIQWVAPSLADQLIPLQDTADKTTFLRVLRAYEYEAASFGMQLLHEAGVTHLDEWYSDFVATDWRYVERFYEEDAIPPWEECVIHHAPRIAPASIPPLAHREVEVRYAF
jgi:hypothetical protein